MLNLKALKEAAEKARGKEYAFLGQDAFTTYVACASPSTILALIERCETLEEALNDALGSVEAARAAIKGRGRQ